MGLHIKTGGVMQAITPASKFSEMWVKTGESMVQLFAAVTAALYKAITGFDANTSQVARTSSAWHTQPDGTLVEVQPGELRIAGALRVDHADGLQYNTTVLGVEYQSNSLPGPFYALLEPATTNLLTSPDSPADQTITPAAGTYTLSMYGAGSVDMSGDATGTATENNPVTVTTTGGTVNFVITGTVDKFQFEAGDIATSFVIGTRTAENQIIMDATGECAQCGNYLMTYIDSSGTEQTATITSDYAVGDFYE